MSQHLPDERLKKSVDFSRAPRGIGEDNSKQAPATAGKAEVAERAWRNEWTAEALPTVPPQPGIHYCWVSTTNQQDPPHRRIRMGYQPVRAEELPGFEHLRMKSGDWEGCISINEMLLFKIPDELYQTIMKELHHTAPQEEEELLRSNIQDKLTVRDSRGAPVPVEITDESNFGGRRSSRPPSFD